MKQALVYILLIVTMVLGASCERRPMYDDFVGNVYIEIELEVDVEMDMEVTRVMPPEVFSVCFYNPKTHELVKTEYVSAKGGFVQIDPGYYDIVVYNFDTDYVQVRGVENMLDLEAFTSEVTSDVTNRFNRLTEIIARNKAPGESRSYAKQPLLYEPDHLFADMLENFQIPLSSTEDEILHIRVHPTTILERYTIKISPVINGEYMRSAETFITGMASSKLIVDRQISGGPATIWFPISLSDDKSYLSTVFYSFGRYDETDANFVLLHMVDQTGNEYDKEWDVTDQLRNGGHDIVIVDEVVVTPTPGGGSSPTVTDWDETVNEIVLN